MKVFVFHDIKLLHDIDIKIYENHDQTADIYGNFKCVKKKLKNMQRNI